MDVAVGLVMLALRLGLPPIYETPAAVVLGVVISLGCVLAGSVHERTVIAKTLGAGTRGTTWHQLHSDT